MESYSRSINAKIPPLQIIIKEDFKDRPWIPIILFQIFYLLHHLNLVLYSHIRLVSRLFLLYIILRLEILYLAFLFLPVLLILKGILSFFTPSSFKHLIVSSAEPPVASIGSNISTSLLLISFGIL